MSDPHGPFEHRPPSPDQRADVDPSQGSAGAGAGLPTGAAPGYPSQAPNPPYPYSAPPSQPLTGPMTGPASGGFQFPQVAPPSQPYTPHPDATQPNAPYAPYAPYPAAPSQPLYGQPAGPSQPYYGPPSQPLPPGAPWPPQQPLAPTPKKSRKGLFIVLALVVLLIGLVGGGAAVVVAQFSAPAAAAVTFCNDLKTQSYDNAYGELSKTLQGKYTRDQFRQAVTALDSAEGKVVACKQSSASNAYTYTLFGSTATVTAVVTRGIQGDLTGGLRLVNEDGAWKVNAMDTSLLGINLGALQTLGAFCAAMQAQQYDAAYALLGTSLQAAGSQTEFTAGAKVHEQVDGLVSSCALATVGKGNTDTATSLTVAVARSKLGSKTGAVTLAIEGGSWKIATMDASLQGSDLRPLNVMAQWCSLVGKGKYGDAYKLMSSGFQADVSKDTFASVFTPIQGYEFVWTCGTADLTSYQVSGSSASLVVPLKLTIPSVGGSSTENFKFKFTLEGDTWTIDDFSTP